MADGHIERLCEHTGILRVGGAYGEPWTGACVLRFVEPGEVMVEGVERAPTPTEWRQAIRVMRASGIVRIRFERHRRGQVERRTLAI